MSEVKTFRCDICGKPFLSDKHKKLFIVSDLTGEGKCYEHICTSCNENLARVITVPNSIRNLEKDNRKLANHCRTLMNKIRDTYYDIVRKPFGYNYDGADAEDYVLGLDDVMKCHRTTTYDKNNTISRLGDMERSRDVWRGWAIGLLIGNALGIILTFIF